MSKGIYCYIDTNNNEIIYIGKDSAIDKHNRHRQHYSKSHYDNQQINRILQNNPLRYQYKILWENNNCSNHHLNQMEIYYISKYNPKFNFTSGGDGCSGFKHSQKTKKKMREIRGGQNHYFYNKKLSKEHKKRISETKSKAQNNSGYYRVSKYKDTRYQQGFVWAYRYFKNEKRKKISSNNLNTLEKKVKAKNLEWKIIDEQKARKNNVYQSDDL